MVNDKICFVISPIGKDGSDIRKRSDLTFNYIIKPIVQEFGYKPIRADYINESGMITNQIIDYIIDSSLVIADLTDSNPNVFYELAVRHIVQKPYIQMMKSNQQIPFDISGMRTIPFDIDLEQAECAKKDLREQIKSIENDNFKAINPVTLAINYSTAQKMIKESGNIESGDITKVVLESVTELRSMIDNMAMDVHNLRTSLNNPIQNNPKFSDEIFKKNDYQEKLNIFTELLAQKFCELKDCHPIEAEQLEEEIKILKDEMSKLQN